MNHDYFELPQPDKKMLEHYDMVLKCVCQQTGLPSMLILEQPAFIAEFDRKTADGWKLNFLTGEYYMGRL